MVRSRQPTGSMAKNTKVAHEYAERGEHSEFIPVQASGE
jgi:hypothetical protein